jgi:hypothetical protein
MTTTAHSFDRELGIAVPEVIQPGGVYYPHDVAQIFQCNLRTIERWNLPWSRLGESRTRVMLGAVLMRHLEKLAEE